MISVMREHDELPPGTAVELRAAINRLEAVVERIEHEGPRTYLWLVSPTRRLFARASTDPADVGVLDHEARVRAVLGERGALRAPSVVELGETWMIEHRIDPLPLVGARAIDIVVEAASTLAGLPVPSAPPSPPEARRARVARRLRTLSTPSLLPDLRRASELRNDIELPTVTTHGDFHPGNLLLAHDAVYVIDWELTAPGPAGSDLLQLWTSLPEADDREQVLGAVVDLVGARYRRDLLRLRYVLLVQTIAAKIATALPASRDRHGARRLLAMLPDVREAASLRTG